MLEMAGIPHEIVVSNADETITGEPQYQVTELALRKARAVLSMLKDEKISEQGLQGLPIIIAADTLVYIDGKVLGKPRDSDEAFEMLRLLSGRMHMVYTGVALVRGEHEHIFSDATNVYFRSLSDEEIRAYIATGEPFDKAGAYGVQERGAVLVERVDGDYFTVVGLPISKVCGALAVLGYDIWESSA